MKTLFKFCNSLLLGIMIATFLGGGITEAAGATVAIEISSAFIPKGVLGVNTYSDTALLAARAFLRDEANKKFNLKAKFTQAIELYLRDRQFSIPNLAEIRRATTQTTEVGYFKKGSFTIGSAKSCSPTGETSGSGKVTVAWITKNFEVISRAKQFDGNDIAKAAALANDLYNGEIALWEDTDQDLVDHLEANKSGVNSGPAGTFDTAQDIMAYNLSQKERFYNFLTADMKKNGYRPEYLELSNILWEADREDILQQGPGNDTNQGYQYRGFNSFSSELIDDGGTIGNNTYGSLHYIVPVGGVALLDWNDPQNVRGAVSGEKSWFTMPSLLRPEFTFDVFKTTECADTTAQGGGTQDLVEKWEFSLNYAKAIQPIDTADETPIFKYGVMTGNNFIS